MAVEYLLAPIPIWYFADLTGKPLGAGKMFTYSSLNKTQQKFVYQDPSGNFPWTDPILFNENGSQGPFYWAFDPATPGQNYYIEVYDRNNILQFTVDNFSPVGAGGGGGNITTAINIQNQLINNVFWRNIGASATPLPIALTLAPGMHSGFGGNALPDITFAKNNTTASDQLTFTQFILGSNPLTGDVTPEFYLNYACNNIPTSETFKYVQIPIDLHVQNYNNVQVTLTIWARCNAGTPTLLLQFLQFFGDGAGASPSVTTPIQTLTLTNTWAKYTVTTTIPSVSGKILGGCGNDATYLQIQYPLSTSTNIDFAKPSMYLGTISPTADMETYDVVDGTINSPRTGDVRVSLNSFQPYGWIPLNDGTIGNASSNAFTRANIDTFQLFNLLWNAVGSTYAPMFNSSGVPVSYGVSAVADFTANNQISLTKQLARVIACTDPGGGFPLGFTSGNLTATLTTNELPAHNHPGSVMSGTSANVFGGGSTNGYVANVGQTPISVAVQGNGAPFSIVQPTVFLNMFMKL